MAGVDKVEVVDYETIVLVYYFRKKMTLPVGQWGLTGFLLEHIAMATYAAHLTC